MEPSFFEQLKKNIFLLSREEIVELSKLDNNGSINNVIVGLEKNAFSIVLKSDNNEDTYYDLVFINSDNELQGYVFQSSLRLEKRDMLALQFCQFLEHLFESIDAIAAFNTYQKQTRTMLEKIGFFTFSNDLINQVKGDNFEMMTPFDIRDEIYVPYFLIKEFALELFGGNDKILNKNRENKIYLILNNRNNFIKIGRSINPIHREKTLQSEDPELLMIKSWIAPKDVEKLLHSEFSNERVRGEWFRLTIKDLFRIKEIMKIYE